MSDLDYDTKTLLFWVVFIICFFGCISLGLYQSYQLDVEAVKAGLVQKYDSGHEVWVKPGCE